MSANSHFSTVANLIRESNVKKGAEIGTWKGGLSYHVLNSFSDLVWFSIDSWKYFGTDYKDGTNKEQKDLDIIYTAVKQKLSVFEKRSIIYHCLSKEASIQIANNSLDLVFIDANHLYEAVKEDINLWTPKVKKGGIVAGHDFSRKHPGVIKAVNELGLKISTGRGGVWWYQK